MGVDLTHYVMIAADLLPVWGKEKVGEFLEQITHPEMGTLQWVYDVMDGKYLMVGKVLACSDVDEGLPMMEILPYPLMDEIREVADQFFKMGHRDIHVSLKVFTHYS